MTRLQTEYQRLYLPPVASADSADAPGLMGADGRVRALVLALSRPADWDALSPLWRGVQSDLELPAPAIAVNGVDAFELWFSLAEPLPVAQAIEFLTALRAHYLRDISPERIQRGALRIYIRQLDMRLQSMAARHGVPQHPSDLPGHAVIGTTNLSPRAGWRFGVADEPTLVRMKPRLTVTSNDAAIVAATAGLGIARLLSYQVAAELAAGRGAERASNMITLDAAVGGRVWQNAASSISAERPML